MTDDDRFDAGPAVAASIVAVTAVVALAVAVALSASAPVRDFAREAGASVVEAAGDLKEDYDAARAERALKRRLAAADRYARVNQNAFDALARHDALARGEPVESPDTWREEASPLIISAPLASGDILVRHLARAGIEDADAAAAAASLRGVYDARKLRAGQAFDLTLVQPSRSVAQIAAGDTGGAPMLQSVIFRPDPDQEIRIRRQSDGRYAAEAADIDLERRMIAVSGVIDGSLYVGAQAAGVHPQVIYDLANVFAYDVDFQRDIQPGDRFEAVYEQIVDDRGEVVGAGELLFARLTWRGTRKEKGYYLFQPPDGLSDYFDGGGVSAKRLLMKTPIDGARVSSGFGVRRHPISGYTRKHKGVDFAAASGTPIKAAGDGVIVRADRFGTFGNYVKIRHANGYETAYAHLKGFSKAARKGRRVRQGDIIGYVGTTGASTGPHLHYEVHKNGSQVNPMDLKVATGRALSSSEMEAFRKRRDEIDALRANAPTPLAARALSTGGQ